MKNSLENLSIHQLEELIKSIQFKSYTDKTIENMIPDLHVRSFNCLKRDGLSSLHNIFENLNQIHPQEMVNIGDKSYKNILLCLIKYTIGSETTNSN